MTIKVCGMRDPANIRAVSRLPIDFVGFIFYEKSPRYVRSNRAILNILAKIPQLKVGVFVNAELDFILSKITDFALDIVQLHGDEPPQLLKDLKAQNEGLKIWKAFAVDASFDFKTTEPYENIADVFLFDTKSPQHGGTGQKFDWTILHRYNNKTPFIIAGGIMPDDAPVIKSLSATLPNMFGVDLNSRFEIQPALKDVNKLSRFISVFKDF